MKCKITSRWASLALFLPLVAWAQEYSFRAFGNSEGLSNLAVRQIYQDRVGFLWVSTEDGIFRYDGERFEGFGSGQGVPLNSAAAFGEAPDGSLLVGGDFGLYHLRGNRFEKLDAPFKTVSWAEGIQADGKGHTFLGTEVGLMELGDGRNGFKIQPVPGSNLSSKPGAFGIFVDGDVLWYGCGEELCRIDNDGPRVFDSAESGLPERAVMVIRKDGAGTLWVRVRNQGVFVRAAGEYKFRRPRTDVPGISMGVPGIDSAGRVLLPLADGLLIGEGERWQKIDQSMGLRGASYAAFEDRQHSLWIGLAGRGLVQWRGYREWESYSTASGLSSDIVYEILPQPGGAMWMGTEGGLVRGRPHASRMEWEKVQSLTGFPVHAVRQEANGDIWVGTEAHGVARFKPTTGTVEWFGEKQGLTGKLAYTLRFDRVGRLWAATESGLSLALPPYNRFQHIAEVPASRIWAIAEGSDGTIWAGGANGLFAMANGKWMNFTRADGLSNQEVLALGTDRDGAMWVGYRFGGGIDRVRLEGSSLKAKRGVQRAGTDGLVYFLEFDRLHRLWVGTEHGLDMWDGSLWSHYNTDDGLAWDDCNLNAFAEDAEGVLWIGTSGGISRFQPLPRAADPSLRVVFAKLVLGKKDVTDQNNLVADIHSNSLIARFTVPNNSRQNGLIFRYRLLGANQSWTETAQRELQFAELAPGSYRLEVQTQDRSGVWSGESAGFDFRVLTPWYSSWWFLSFCVLTPVSLTAGGVRLRMLHAQRRERELEQLRIAHEEIRNLAFFDPLTSLPNRRLLLDRLRQVQTGSKRTARKAALLFIDLDDFKTLNDTLGHHVGDLLLQEVAQRISQLARESDTVARLGGDEFVVLLQNLSETAQAAANQAKHVAEKILAMMNQPYLLSGRECRSSCSIGITVFGEAEHGTNEILQQADIAMYQAKSAGRNTVRFFAPALQAAVNARAAMEKDLRQAIEKGAFTLHYQPQVNGDAMTGAEALLRWEHPRRGYIPPSEFIVLAEETGLILPLGEWVLEAACKQIAAWSKDPRTARLTLAVNISAKQLLSPSFAQDVLSALQRTGANAGNLELELTESMFVENVEEVIGRMTQLKAHGLRFSLDDFGTGYSSLAYLRRLPLDQLKIDQAFVRDLLEDRSSSAIAQSIIALSNAMGLSVIAEGVETEGQRDFLARLGCHTFQGYFFGRPLPLHEFEQLLSAKAMSVSASQR